MTPTTVNAEDTARLVASLIATGRSVAVAESLTGGAVLAKLVGVPGASKVVRGGIVAYDTALNASLLGVSGALLDEHGPVHPEVAVAMAEGVRMTAAVGGHPADIGVATTGVAGPDPQANAPVGLVYVAVADAEGSTVRENRFTGDRATVRALATHAALALLADHEANRKSVALGNVIPHGRVTDSSLTTAAQVAAVTVIPRSPDSVAAPAHSGRKTNEGGPRGSR
jgi:nicotinamide-nucleotide amidase